MTTRTRALALATAPLLLGPLLLGTSAAAATTASTTTGTTAARHAAGSPCSAAQQGHLAKDRRGRAVRCRRTSHGRRWVAVTTASKAGAVGAHGGTGAPAGAGAAAGGLGGAASAEPVTLRGRVVLLSYSRDRDESGAPTAPPGECATDGYDDVHAGAPVQVRDAKGAVLATGQLGAGYLSAPVHEHQNGDEAAQTPGFDFTSGLCTHDVEIPAVPGGAGSYTLWMTGYGGVTATRAALVAHAWAMPNLEIG